MVRTPTHHRDFLTDNELNLLVKTIRDSKTYLPNTAGEYLRKRDEVIILLAAYTGLRPTECLELKWVDIDFEHNEINIDPWTNKQREAKPAILPNKAKELLIEYHKFCSHYINSLFLFPSLSTLEPITASAMAKKFHTISNMAGINKIIFYTHGGQPISNTTFYSLRKYYGNKIYNRTGDPYKTMRALRHLNMDSIKFYTEPTKESIKCAVDYALGDF